MTTDLTRRGILGMLVCAPAIVRVSSLMKLPRPDPWLKSIIEYANSPSPFNNNIASYITHFALTGHDENGTPRIEMGMAYNTADGKLYRMKTVSMNDTLKKGWGW